MINVKCLMEARSETDATLYAEGGEEGGDDAHDELEHGFEGFFVGVFHGTLIING